MSPPIAHRRRRLRNLFIGTAVAACTVLGSTVISSPASAEMVDFGSCGRFEMDGSIRWVYAGWGATTGQLGCPTSGTGFTPDGMARYSQFQNGSIYWKSGESGAVPHVILDPARYLWALQGWERSAVGYPTIDTWNVPNKAGEPGSGTEFENGSIFTSPSTGTHSVDGDIWRKWKALDFSKTGFPTSDVEAFDNEGGLVQHFEGGDIYWWKDTGAIPVLGLVRVLYTGLQAYEETDWDRGSNSDEPYAILGAITRNGSFTTRSQVYSDVDTGEGRAQRIQLYRGAPHGITLSTVIMENDDGDPNAYKSSVEAGVKLAADGVVTAVGFVPGFGPVLAKATSAALNKAIPAISKAVNDLLDTGDDRLGSDTFTLSPKQMVVMSSRGTKTDLGVPFKKQTADITGGGSRYRASFTVEVWPNS